MLKGIVSGTPVDISRIAMRGKNLFAYTAATIGKYINANGQEVESISQSDSSKLNHSDFISISGGTEYTISCKNIATNTGAFCWYDNSRTMLSRSTFSLSNADYTVTKQSPLNAVYMIVNYCTTQQSTVMINEYQEGWEVRDQNGAILWAANKTLTGTNSIAMKGYGLPLVGMTLEGNETQTGTPDPTTPIWPEECGEKTVNILDSSAISQTKNGVTYTVNPDKSITIDGMLDRETADYIELYELNAKSGQAYTISGVTGFTAATLQIFTTSSSAFPAGNRLQCYDTPTTRTALADEKCYVRLYVYRGVRYENVTIFPMIVLGNDTTRPYEPYGYKIPITLNGATQNIYLNEPLRKIGDYADTINSDGTVTRRISKQAITELANRDNFNGGYTVEFSSPCGSNTVLSNIAISTSSLPTAANRQGKVFTNSGRTYIGFGSQPEFPIANTSGYPTTDEKAAFLSYISTHEVYVWYVLATPTTEQVTIPTLTPADGNDTLTVGTTLAPSALSITGHVKARSV